MATLDLLVPQSLRAHGVSAEEWQLRLELAAFYRLVDAQGWTEMIYNHITLRVPGAEPHFLINPYGLNYSEVTAQNLVKIDLAGNVLDGSENPVNLAGFVIHGAIHAVRHDAHCVVHTHTTAGMAVACKAEGLRHDNFYSAEFVGDVGYHEFEGISVDLDERSRLAENLGNRRILILRNHGLVVVGPNVPAVFEDYWRLQRACEIQMASDAMIGPNQEIRPEVLQAIPRQLTAGRGALQASGVRRGQVFFDAALRRAGLELSDLAGG
ncbi:MAG: class II aldolase/adducin family protein [Chloroflexota bacterium]